MIENERRYFPRFPFHARAIAVFPLTYRDVTLLDISTHGAFVEAIDARGFFAGARCALRVLGAADRQVLEVNAIVMHCMEDRRFGLGLRNINPGAENALRRMIEMNLGTEALLRRELCVLLKPAGPVRQSPAKIPFAPPPRAHVLTAARSPSPP